MLKLLEVTLHGLPPTVNQMYRNAGTARRYKTKKAHDYQLHAVKIMEASRLLPYAYTGFVIMDIVFYAPNKRKWDIDNRFKALQDCLEMARIIKDDSQIRKIMAERINGSIERTEITVFTMQEET